MPIRPPPYWRAMQAQARYVHQRSSVRPATGACWRQAGSDHELAELVLSNGFHGQACFRTTLTAEKALKGAIMEPGGESP